MGLDLVGFTVSRFFKNMKVHFKGSEDKFFNLSNSKISFCTYIKETLLNIQVCSNFKNSAFLVK